VDALLGAQRLFRRGYLIFLAMVFDALDGRWRVSRATRPTSAGQLDSLADVVSFGAGAGVHRAHIVPHRGARRPSRAVRLARLIWAIGALYFSCAALRLARFNVSNEHGEQHHYSFLGLPSPGAGGTVAAWILMQQDLRWLGTAMGGGYTLARQLASIAIYILPVIVWRPACSW
jgi:CDP-diacylglycerol--serine O-phosphatidyltransferase